MKKTFFFIFLSFFLFVSMLSAVALIDDAVYGTSSANSDITLFQYSNETSCNITRILSPDSTVLLSNVNMSRDETVYSYFVDGGNFSIIGRYTVSGECENNIWTYWIDITPSGFAGLSQYYWLIIVIVICILGLGFYLEDHWILVIGSVGLLFLGFLIMTQGIDFVKNTNYTYPIGIILWGLAFYIMFRSLIELLKARG